MGAPTRFKNGVTNVDVTSPLNLMGQMDPTQYITFFDDFCGQSQFPIATSGLAAASNTVWTITVTEAGAGDAASAITTGGGGQLLITNDAADNDLVQAQVKQAPFYMTGGKKSFFKARFKISDATQSDLLIGLATIDTSLQGSTGGDGVTDGIFFYKDDGVATLNISAQKNSTTGQVQATAITTLADATYVSVAWAYDGRDRINYYINDVYKGYIDGTSTYLPDDTTLAVSFAHQNGEAVAKTLTIDYLFAAQER